MTTHPEAARAKAWRESHGLTVERLAELTGYSTVTIFWFEKGCTPPMRRHKSGRAKDRSISDWVWHRYRLTCAAVDQQLQTGKTFAW